MKYTLSAPQRPMFESAPYRQSPWRREFIHGKIHPLDCKCKVCRQVAS